MSSCPGVVKLNRVYQDADHWYLLMESWPQGDLAAFISKNAPIEEN